MSKERLQAFSDGVLAIIITIMVLQFKTPEGATFNNLKPMLYIFPSYVFSFIFVGIYWNNHHHLFQAIEKVNGKIMWANLFLLFWISLLPFATSWIGEHNFAENPVALYGFVLLMCGVAFNILEHLCIGNEGKDSTLANALSSRLKEKLSIAIYIAGIGFSFVYPIVSVILYVVSALMWIIPDLRIEEKLN